MPGAGARAELTAGRRVVLDNLPVHKAAGLAELVAARGAQLLYLLPYSPDFTPIELVFSKLKTQLRTAAARTREALRTALASLDNKAKMLRTGLTIVATM